MKKIKKSLFISLLLGLFCVAGCVNEDKNSSSNSLSSSTNSIAPTGSNSSTTSSVSSPNVSSVLPSSSENSSPDVSSPITSTPDVSSPIVSSPDLPIVKQDIYLFGSAVSGNWEDYITLTEDDDGYFYDYLNLTNAMDGFVICETENLQDSTKFCLHDENNNNFSVLYSGSYLFALTWNDMSGDSDWKVAVDSNAVSTKIAYYKLEAQFEFPQPKNVLYIYGPGISGGSWSNAVDMEEIESGVYYIESRFTNSGDGSQGFVINEMSALGDKTGFCLHKNGGGNFVIPANGTYKFYVSLNDMSSDSTWIAAVDSNLANNLNPREHYFYKFVEVSLDNPPVITTGSLWLFGPAIADSTGTWTSGTSIPQINATTYSGVVRISTSTDGFVIYEKVTKTDGYQLKTDGNTNITLARAGFASPVNGIYRLTVTWNDMSEDTTWFLATTNLVGGSTVKEAYFKIIDVNTEEKVDLAVPATATATSSSVGGTASRTASKALDKVIEDNNRWESASSDPQWLLIDLGAEYNIDEITICWFGAASAKTYKLEVSTDGDNYQLVKDYTNDNAVRQRVDDHLLDTPVAARFVRIYGTARVATYGYSIGKVYVYQASEI